MSEPSTHSHHGINYIEFGATDIDASREFYERAFGWSFNEYGPDYLGIRKEDGGEAGGITRADAVQTGGPLVVLYSKDLRASLASVQAAGGRVVKEIFDFPGGSRFEFLDPSGNALAVWSEKA